VRVIVEEGVERRGGQHRIAPGLDLGLGSSGNARGQIGGQGAEAVFDLTDEQAGFALVWEI
jgi:hypothetical protein